MTSAVLLSGHKVWHCDPRRWRYNPPLIMRYMNKNLLRRLGANPWLFTAIGFGIGSLILSPFILLKPDSAIAGIAASGAVGGPFLAYATNHRGKTADTMLAFGGAFLTGGVLSEFGLLILTNRDFSMSLELLSIFIHCLSWGSPSLAH